MLHAIAQILRAQIGELPWIERYGGLVDVLTVPQYTTVNDAAGTQQLAGQKIYPVACGVTAQQCFESADNLKRLVPSTAVGSLAFFVDTSGVSMRGLTGPKDALMSFSFSLRFLVWLNLARLGVESCTWAGRAAPYIIDRLSGAKIASGNFDGGPEETMYRDIVVTRVAQLAKTPSLFSPFSFATEGESRGLFLYPYDYMGFQIEGTFSVVRGACLPAIVDEPFEFYDSFCWPLAGGGSGGGSTPGISAVEKWLNERPFYPNDEAARADGLATDKYYFFSQGTDRGIAYALKRVEPLT